MVDAELGPRVIGDPEHGGRAHVVGVALKGDQAPARALGLEHAGGEAHSGLGIVAGDAEVVGGGGPVGVVALGLERAGDVAVLLESALEVIVVGLHCGIGEQLVARLAEVEVS